VEAEAATGEGSPPPGPSPSDLVAGPRRLKKSRGGTASAPLPIPGGPLAIPAAKVDLDSVRVERFAETGGTTLDGRLLDVDTRQPVAGAHIEAWMGTRSIHAQSDSDGRFRFEGLVPKSKITLWITASPTFVQERLELAVPGNDRFQTTYQLLARSSGTGSRDAGIGLYLSRRGARTVVTGLTPWGPAERAGIQTGEAVVAVGKRDVTALGPGAIDFLLKGPMGTEVTLTVQAGSAPPRTLTLKRSGR
jgi:PDZ domain